MFYIKHKKAPRLLRLGAFFTGSTGRVFRALLSARLAWLPAGMTGYSAAPGGVVGLVHYAPVLIEQITLLN